MAMKPTLLMAIITNFHIGLVLYFIAPPEILYSPVLGNILFLVLFWALSKDRVSVKAAFFIAAYTTAAEVIVHTHYLGWSIGFYFYLFLIPVIFLLNSKWKLGTAIFLNSSVVLIAFTLWYLYHESGVHRISESTEELIFLINVAGVGVVVLVVMIYFRTTLYEKDEALIKANKELEFQNKEISEQHARLQTLIKEVHHRVKNNLQIISSLMSLQRRNVQDANVALVLEESRKRVEAIALIHQKLYQDNKANKVDFKLYLEELMASQQMMAPHVQCSTECSEAVLSLDTAVPLGLVVSELITNSLKHAFVGIEKPEISVRLELLNKEYRLTVNDNGVGLPDGFSLDNPESLGTEIVIALTGQIEAQLNYLSEDGTTFVINFKDELVNPNE